MYNLKKINFKTEPGFLVDFMFLLKLKLEETIRVEFMSNFKEI